MHFDHIHPSAPFPSSSQIYLHLPILPQHHVFFKKKKIVNVPSSSICASSYTPECGAIHKSGQPTRSLTLKGNWHPVPEQQSSADSSSHLKAFLSFWTGTPSITKSLSLPLPHTLLSFALLSPLICCSKDFVYKIVQCSFFSVLLISLSIIMFSRLI